MIRSLQEDVTMKDNLLKKAAEDMKFYKLELVNREDSYNKMFGTNPNIGFINPLAGKPQTGKHTIVGAGNKAMQGMGMGISGSTPNNMLGQKDGRKNSRMVQQ